MPTIGVFDSGFGGLTVLRALLPLVPGAHYLYLGDTARLPYGAKSQATIARYAVESAKFLEDRGAEHLVIACNTASALALDDIRAAVSIPVHGVIEPGAQAAAAFTQNSKPQTPNPSHTPPAPTPLEVLVLATAATVHSHAYRRACAALGLTATEFPCPLLVPLVEEGWTEHPVTAEVLRIYLTEALSLCTPQAVILGCTHYPLIAAAIERTLRQLGCQTRIIDSATATAHSVAQTIQVPRPFRVGSHNPQIEEGVSPATFTCFATDSVEKFQLLGSKFLHQPIPQVRLLDLGG